MVYCSRPIYYFKLFREIKSGILLQNNVFIKHEIYVCVVTGSSKEIFHKSL